MPLLQFFESHIQVSNPAFDCLEPGVIIEVQGPNNLCAGNIVAFGRNKRDGVIVITSHLRSAPGRYMKGGIHTFRLVRAELTR